MQRIIPLGDLRHLRVECDRCATVVIVDLDKVFTDSAQNPFSPQSCPMCMASYDSAVSSTIDRLIRVFRAIPATLRKTISFTDAAEI